MVLLNLNKRVYNNIKHQGNFVFFRYCSFAFMTGTVRLLPVSFMKVSIWVVVGYRPEFICSLNFLSNNPSSFLDQPRMKYIRMYSQKCHKKFYTYFLNFPLLEVWF